jgi:hypothetical protein
MASQWPIEKKIAKADFVVWSEGALEILAVQIDRVVAQQSLPASFSR